MGDGGATVSPWYDIYVVHHASAYSSGKLVATLTAPLLDSNNYGVKFVWSTPQELLLVYSSAKSATLKAPRARIGDISVSVALRKTGASGDRS
jgi:hypothetical protein